MPGEPQIVTAPANRARGALSGEVMRAHLDRLDSETTVLMRELERAHAQLRLAFEVMECVSGQQDTAQIEQTLLRRLAGAMGAGAVFLDSAGCCMQIPSPEPDKLALRIPPNHLRAILGNHVETTRRARRARVVHMSHEEREALDSTSVLLATLPRANGETGVVITLRDAQATPFDENDVQACETVLSYGAHALRNAATIQELQRSAIQTVCALVNAIDAKDNYTSDHSERVGGLARMTGEALGLPRDRLQALEWAGLLHDVGKIGVAEEILNKPGVLTASEAAEMRRHPRIGFDMLRPVAQLKPVLEAVLYHHENHDGSGYPDARRGNEVPLEARIVHVADIFDALTTARPYRRAHDVEHALKMLGDDSGRVTDPDVTALFINTMRRYMTQQPCELRARFAQFTGGAQAGAGR